MSKVQIFHDGKELDVNIIVGNWRIISTEVNDDLTIDMKVPVGIKKEMIEKYLDTVKDSIVSQYEYKKNRNHQSLPITLELEEGKIVYHNGLRLPFLGNMSLLLRIIQIPKGENTGVYVEKGKGTEQILTIRTDNMDQNFLRYCIMRYYKKTAYSILKKSVEEYSKKMGLSYRNILITNLLTNSRLALPRLSYSNLEVKNQMTLWGRCTRKQTLKFDWKLAMLPMEIIEYIIVHELAHLKKMNHSAAFWKEIENVMPEYRECKNWLAKHGKEYEIF